MSPCRPLAALLALSVLACEALGAGRVHDVLAYGADPSGRSLCTAALQEAIDAAADGGGGTVLFGSGTFRSGALRLRSRVALRLEEGATLLGSRELQDYLVKPRGGGKPVFRHLLDGRGVHDVSIIGPGTIDGNGDAFRDVAGKRPKNIHLENCRNALIEGVRLRNAGSWMQHYRLCDGVTIRGIDVFNHAAPSNDGLTIDSSRNVAITGVRVDSDDDGIVLKSLSEEPVSHVRIADSWISSHCNALKLGTESRGGFLDIAVSSIVISSPRRSKSINGLPRGLAGLVLAVVDGGRLEHVTVSDVRIEGVTTPLFLRLGDRGRSDEGAAKPGLGTLRGVRFRNIKAKGMSALGCAVAGHPKQAIEDVSFENIEFEFEGGGDPADLTRRIPERAGGYPESTMFGGLPAYGFYCRHVRGLRFSGVRLNAMAADPRHAMVFDDARDIAISGLSASAWPAAAAPLGLRGAATRGVVLDNFEWREGSPVADFSPEVAPTAFTRRR